MKGFVRLYFKYGLIMSIVAVMGVVAMLTYRLGDSPWRWPLGAVILAGIGTVIGIVKIRKYVDSQTKTSDEQGDK